MLDRAMGLLNTNNFFGIKGSFDELKWIWNLLKAFYPTEYNHLMATKDISQPNLLT